MAAAGKKVVISGAGPAGLLTAIYFAKKLGCQVQVFDRRPRPQLLRVEDEERKEDRAFFVLAHQRAVDALTQAGIDAASLTVPGTGLLRYTQLVLGGRRRVAIPYACLGGEQQHFVQALASAAEALQQQEGAELSVHWGAEVTSVDLAARQLVVLHPDGREERVSYDLLVGADGWASVVRQAAEQQVPGFRASTEHSPVRYKVFHLEPHDALPMAGPAGGYSHWSFMSRSYGGAPTQGSLFLDPETPHQHQHNRSATGDETRTTGGETRATGGESNKEGLHIKGVLAMNWAGWGGLQSPADYEALLAREFPQLPADCAVEIAAQLAHQPSWPSGTRMLCSQLHGPSMVLVGDAAHGVSPRIGNGLTAALEDAQLLTQTLVNAGCDLAKLPELWTAARLADAQALHWLDEQWLRRFGRGPAGRLDPACFANLAAMLVWLVMSRWGGGRWVAPPPAIAMNTGDIAYRQAKARMQRDDAVVGMLAAAALAAVAARWRRSG